MLGFANRWQTTQRVVALMAPVAVLVGMLPAQPVQALDSAADAAPSSAELNGRLQSASWRWMEKLPDGTTFQQMGPLVTATVGPGGQAVWAGQWSTSQPVSGDISLRFKGLPPGVKITPAGFPAGVTKKAKVIDCAGSDCRVRMPKGETGQQSLTSAVVLRGTKALSVGTHPVNVTLLVNGSEVPKMRETLILKAAKKTPTEFYVSRLGAPLITSGQPGVHKISAYRLSGPAKANPGKLTLSNVIDKRLRSGVKVKGPGWRCKQGKCSIREKVAVGERATPVGLLWQIRNRHVKAWPKIDTAKAHDAKWWTRYAFNGEARGRLRQQNSLVAAQKATKPEYKNSQQVLAKTKRAQVTAMVQQLGPARLRGDGLFSVQVGNGGSRDAKNVRLRIKPPTHSKITKIKHAKKWKCSGATCRWRGVLKQKKTLPPIKVLLKSSPKAKAPARKQPFVAVASWNAAKQKGRKSDRGVSKAAWLKPLTVSAMATNQIVHSKSGIKTQLQAQIGNAGEAQVHYRWRQVAGPAVKWVSHLKGSVGDGSVAARFTPPKVKKKTKLTFKVTAMGSGAKVTDTVTVKAVPAGVKGANWDPRIATTVPLSPEEATKKFDNPQDPSTFQPLKTKAAATALVNKPHVTYAKPGQRVALKVGKRTYVKGAKVRRTTWAVNGRKPTKALKPALSRNGRTLKITVPKSQTETMYATASMALNKGRRVDVGELVVMKSPKPVSTAASARLSGAFSGATFCDYFSGLTVSDTFTIGDITFTASGVTPTGSSCTASGASLTITANPVETSGVTLSGLSMTMNSSSITLGAASISLPDGPDGAVAPIDLSGSLTASWTSSGPSSLAGTFTASGLSTLPYLQLPDGWAIATGTFSFSAASGNTSFSLSITATGPDEGQASLTGSIATGGVFSLNAAMQNALTLTGYDGSTAVFGGSGSVARSSTGAFTYDVQLDMTTTSFEIINDVSLGSASLQWDNTGLSLNGSVTTTIGSDSVVFTASATVTNFSTWTATISTTATPSVGSLPLVSLTGTFGYASSAFTFDVSASVTVTDVSNFLDLTLTTASASIMNTCPAGDTTCNSSDLRLVLDVAGSVELFSDTIAINTAVDVDLTTGQFDADFSLAGTNFGPSEAQLNSVSFFVANDGAADPNLAGNPCAPSGTGTVYGFTATATILNDVDFAVTGVYQDGTASNPAGSGYCFYGEVTTSDISQLNGAGLDNSLNFLYATYATTADGQNIPATSPTMWANMTLPSQVQTYIGNAVTGFTVLIEMVTTNGSVTGLTIDGMVDMQAYVAGSATDLPSFELTSIGVALEVSTAASASVEVSFDCDALLTTPGNSAGSMTQSVMDFTASIGITTTDGGSLNLAANLTSSAPVANAFGVQGLTVQDLGIAANIGFDALLNSSLTISTTNLELPSNIAGPIGLSATAPIDFSLTVGIVAPCFYISIGTPNQTTNAAIDWGGVGVLEAYYFSLLLAPLGNCTEADGTKITGNFAVDFNGYIFGDEVYINGEVEITPEFSADLDLEVGGFNLAGMSLQTTTIDLNFDPAGGTFDLNFSGGANLWSAIIVQVSGAVDINLAATSDNIDIQFDGFMSENLFGLFTSSINVDVGVDAGQTDGTFYLSELEVSLSGAVKVLIFEANASFTLDYANGGVQTLSGSFGASIDLYIISFGVEISFSYDPAQTGNQNLTITITGWMDIDLWLFKIKTNVSISFDIDASFLASSEYQPQPTQQVAAPTSLAPTATNTNPNTWSWNTGMYQANNFGWMANLVSNYQAVSDAANASTVKTKNDAFDQIWNAAYLTSSEMWLQSTSPDPQGYSWLGSNSWPGAYVLNNSSSAFSVVPTQGTATIGNSTTPTNTNSQLEVTATLPPSPLAQNWSLVVTEAQVQAEVMGQPMPATYLPSASCVTENTTQTWNVQIPEVPNPTPNNWSWVIMDTNWRMYGASLRETASTMIDGWAGGMPSYDEWIADFVLPTQTVDGTYGAYTLQSPGAYAMVPIPYLDSTVAEGFTFDCGYTDFATQTSLHDFMSEQGIPWSAMPPPTGSNSYSDLQPGWGQGWQPYDLTNTQYSNLRAYSVWTAPNNNWSGTNMFPCTNGVPTGASITKSWPVGQLWGDPNNNWIDIPSGGYVQLEPSSNSSLPWSLHLYNSSDEELQWNGNSWVTAPSGGFTSAYQPLSSAGQLYAMDANGVIYWSQDEHGTYLAFTSSNPLATQAAEGVLYPTYNYVPSANLNNCSSGEAVYANPNATQGTTLTSPPTFPSLTSFNFGANQAYFDSTATTYPTCSSGVPQSFSTTMNQQPVVAQTGGTIPLGQYGASLRLQNSSGVWSLHLYNSVGQEWRLYEGSLMTEPSTGWPSGAEVFGANVILRGASPTGVMASFPMWNGDISSVYLWFSQANPMATSGATSYTATYTPDPGLNSCSSGSAVYSGS